MSEYDGLVGAAVGAAASYLGGQQTNQANAEIAAANNAWAAQQYATRYQTTVKDLTAAGLNPMLAYSQGPGSAPTPSQVQFQNPVASAVSAFNEIRGTSSSSAHHYAAADQAKHMNDQIDATVDQIKESTKNIPDQGKQIRQTVQKLADESALLAEKGLTEHAIRKQLSATISKLHSETNLLNLDAAAAAKFDNLGREAKQYAPIVDLIKEIVRSRR